MPEDVIGAFAGRTRRYCAFIEGAASLPVIIRIARARELLAELVAAACRLPEGDADGPDADQEVSMPSDWPGFEEADLYWEVFDPYEEAPLVCGSLSDDLLDVYRDLRRGLLIYDAGKVGSAVWEWKFHFTNHWGDHAVDALRALQRAFMRFAGD